MSDQPINPERDDAPGAGESDRAAASDKPAEKADGDAGSSPDTADEDSRQYRRPWTLLIWLLAIALVGPGASSAEQIATSDQPISPERDDAPGAGESDRAATSDKPAEKADGDAGSGPGTADEDSRQYRRPWTLLIWLLAIALVGPGASSAEQIATSDQPISPERDDAPGAGESNRAATFEKPAERADGDAGFAPDTADEDSRQHRRPWMLLSELLVISLLVFRTSDKPAEKADEDASSGPDTADEESRQSDQPLERDDTSGAGESDRVAAFDKPAQKADEDASSGPDTADEESRQSDQPIERDDASGAGESDRAAAFDKPAQKADEDAGSGSDKAHEESRQRRRPWILLIGLLVIALLILAGVYYWWSTRNIESTDDAYTDGRAITIAPRVAGEVISLDVTDNQFVKQGQALIHIDPRQYKIDRAQAQGALATAEGQYAGQQLAAEVGRKNFPAQLEQAKAQLESAKASLAKAQADYNRQLSLHKQATTQQDVDQAATALWQAQAQVMLAEAQVKQNSPVPQLIGQTDAQVKQLKGQVEQAQARLDQTDLNLSWTTVAAPQDGWITKRNVEKGNYVVAGQQIFSIVTPEVWITANFKETQLTNMRPGQPVKISIDAYPALDVRGHVDSIQRGSGSRFTAFPPENATGNFVKIVQRVPVKIVIDSGLSQDIVLPLGISVVPTVTVR
jgi:membrane fusion protein (multidrug efflux system)